MDLPDLDNAKETATKKAKGLIPWLRHFECDHCGEICRAEVQYVEREAYYCKVWQCPNEDCGARYYREDPHEAETEPPRERNRWERR